MPQIYPFSRANGSDFNDGDEFSGAQATTIDKNASQAADGLQWSDLAAARLWPYSATISGAKVLVQGLNASATPVVTWKLVGTSDMHRVGHGGNVWIGTTDAAIMTTPLCAAVDSTGLNIVIGGNGGASATKYAYATTGTNAALSTANSTDSTAATINTLCFVGGSVNLFVGGLSDGDIETSPTGQTWTARTTPNANARRQLVTNGTDLVAAVTSASTDKYITSSNATSWTERSFPTSSTGGYYLEYSAYAAKWFASNNETGALYKSTDCINWSSVTTNMTVRGPMVAVGRVLAMVAINFSPVGLVLLSVDEGLTWVVGTRVSVTSGITCFTRGFNNRQLAIVSDDDTVWLSAHIADPTSAYI